MKKLLIFLLVFSCHALSGQDYRPLVVENAHWQMYAVSDNLGGYDHHGFVIRGDTLVADQVYHKVYKQDLTGLGEFGGPPFGIVDEFLFALLREDTLERKVYAIPYQEHAWGFHCPLGEEHLLYDFSLTPEELFDYCSADFQNYILDSVYTENLYGADRRVFRFRDTLDFDSPYNRWIEGIGAATGLFSDLVLWPTTANWSLYLYDYCVGTDEACGLEQVNRTVQNTLPALQVYPNPSGGRVWIEHLSGPAEVRLYNPTGQLVFSDRLSGGSKELVLLPPSLSPGHYHLTIRSGREAVTFSLVLMP